MFQFHRPASSGLTSAVALSVTLLAACSPARDLAPGETDPAGVSGPSASMSAQGQEASAGRNIFELRTAATHNMLSTGGSGTGIYYHGGTVLSQGIRIQTIYWYGDTLYRGGPKPSVSPVGAGTADGSLIGTLLRDLGASTHYAINGTYTDGAGAPINASVTYTGYWANGASVPASGASVTDAQMIAMLQSGFNSNALSYDANTLYVIFTGPGVNLGGGAGSQYCAYHTNGSVTISGASKRVYYAAMPYNASWLSGCTSKLAPPNGDLAADAEINTLVHEIEETHTDALGNAWFDRRGYENADKCAWNWGTTKTTASGGVYNVTIGTRPYLIQQNWINSGSGGCRQTI